MKGWRSWSGGVLISSEDAQILRLGPSPGQGRDPADSAVLLLCSYSNVFCSPEQKLHCYAEHFMNLKSFIWNWSLNDFLYLPGLLAIPFKYRNENEEGLCCYTCRFQRTVPESQRARGLISIPGLRPSEGSAYCRRLGAEASAIRWLGKQKQSLFQQQSLFHPLA